MVDVSVKINLKNVAADSDLKNLDAESRSKGRKEKKDLSTKKMELSDTEIGEEEMVATSSKDDEIFDENESPVKEEEDEMKSKNSKDDLRDVGSDLDDLLDKISTIVDYADAEKKKTDNNEGELKSPSKKSLNGDKKTGEKLLTDSNVNTSVQSDGEDLFEDAFDITPTSIEAISSPTSEVNNKYHDINDDDKFDDLEAKLKELDNINDDEMEKKEQCDDSDILLLDLGKDNDSNENEAKETLKSEKNTISSRTEESSTKDKKEVKYNIDEEIVEIPEDDEDSNSKITDMEFEIFDEDGLENEELLSKPTGESKKLEISHTETECEILETKSIENSELNGTTKHKVEDDADSVEEGELEEGELEEELEEKVEDEKKDPMKEEETSENLVKIPNKSTKKILKIDNDYVDLVESEETPSTTPEENIPTSLKEYPTTFEDTSMESLLAISEEDMTTSDNSIGKVANKVTTTSTKEKLDKKDDDEYVEIDDEVEEESPETVENTNDEDSKENKTHSDKIMDADDKLDEIPPAIEALTIREIPAKIDIAVGDIPTKSNTNKADEVDSDDDVMVINDDDDDNKNNVNVLKDTVKAKADMKVELTEIEKNAETTNDDVIPTKSNSCEQQVSNDDTTEILAKPAVVNDDEDDITEVFHAPIKSRKIRQNIHKVIKDDNGGVVLIIEEEEAVLVSGNTRKKFDVNKDRKETSTDERATADCSASKSGQEEGSGATTKSTNDHEKTNDETDLMIVDNSDNACDQFEKRKDNTGKKKSTDDRETEEINSNSSSNLLRPRKRTTPEEEDRQSESADVELTYERDGDGKRNLNGAKEPLSKRLRLSVDNKLLPEKSAATQKNKSVDISVSVDNNIKAKEVPNSSDLKRARCSIDVNNDDDTKEAKTKKEEECKYQEVKKKKMEKTCLPAKEGELKNSDCMKVIAKLESKPLKIEKMHLVPEDDTRFTIPDFLEKFESPRIEYIKRYRRFYSRMTRTELEQFMVLKITETLQINSLFAELKATLHRQDCSLKMYRTRYAELKKRYHDLDVIHTNLKKDVQDHNSKQIVPPKVTRSVALNVNLLAKKPEGNMPPSSSTIVSNTLGVQSPSISMLGQRPVQRSTQLYNLQRASIPPLIATKRTSEPPIISTNNQSANLRRGCVQKITPQRPMPHALSASNNVGTRNPVVVPQTSSQVKTPPKVLNKNAPVRPQPTSISSTAAAASLLNRGRQSLPIPSTDYKQDNTQRTLGGIPGAKPTMRRSDVTPTLPTAVVNVPTTAFGNGSIPTAPNLTSAKPKEKAVIDLTDEDESAELAWRQQQAAQAQNRSAQISMPAQGTVPARQRPPGPMGAGVRRSPSSFAPRLPTPQRAQQPTGARQPPQNAVQRAPSSVSLPPGTNISRVITNSQSMNSRTRYTHPAPLPPVPPPQYKADWKLPPPRPQIRISLMENGIVISWTMEDLNELHAECVSYQIYAYQETRQLPSTDLWRHVGDVKSMLLPMAVTLNQFQENQRYYFAVRAVDEHKRLGPFSLPKTWP